MSDVNSATAALGANMTQSEIGRQKAAEADIVDFLREAGDALSSSTGGAPKMTQMPPRKALRTRFVNRLSLLQCPHAESQANI